jgi:dynein heavy chain 1
VNAKYDQWQKDILAKFGAKLGASVKELHTIISKSRHSLERSNSVDLASADTNEAVGFIIFVQELKRKVSSWSDDVELYKASQKTLEKNRFRFPDDWLYIDHLEGEWSAFNSILKKKNQVLQDETGLNRI